MTRGEAPAEPLRSFFGDVGRLLDEEVHLRCCGGFVVTQFYGVARTTSDVDFLSAVLSLPGYLTEIAGRGLGGQLKTGHRWALQNRPIELTQNKITYTLAGAILQTFSRDGAGETYTGFTWAEDAATQGCDRSAGPAAGR